MFWFCFLLSFLLFFLAEGQMEVNMTEVPMEEIELKLKRLDIQFGGHWKPKDCKPRWKV